MHFFPGACPRLRRTSGDVRVRTGCVGSCRLLCVNQSAENAQHAVQTYIREFCYPGTGLTGAYPAESVENRGNRRVHT